MKLKQIKNLSRQTWVDLTCLTIGIAVFYFIWLGSYPLFTPDEGRYTEVAREMLVNHDFITPRLDSVPFLDKPALYYWLQAVSLHWFGIKEWAVRFFPACFGMLGCLMVYGAGRYLFCRRTGLLAAIVLATSPLYFAAAHYANLDLEVAVLISGALLAFLCAFKNKDKPNTFLLYTAYAMSGLAFLTKGMIGIVFPALIIGSFIVLQREWRMILKIRLFTGLLLSAVIALPWYFLAQQANPQFFHYFFVEQQVTRFLSTGQFNNKTPFWFYLPIVLVGFLPWTCFLFHALINRTKAVFAHAKDQAPTLFLLLWAGIVFIFFSIPHSKTISYILPVFPPLALITANYLIRGFENAKRRALPSVIFAISTGILGSFLLLNCHFQWLNLPLIVNTYLTAISVILIFGGVTSLVLSHLRLSVLVGYMTSWSIIFLLTVVGGAAHLNERTTKPLITTLNAVLKPGDQVVNYYTFYQDVPLYLNQTIILVADWQSPTIAQKDNWIRELWVQMKDRKENNLIDNQTFANRWRSPQQLYVFLDAKYLNQLQETVGDYHLINQYHDIVLVSNR